VADPAIAAHGLVKHFGPVVALDGIDLAVQAGSVLGLPDRRARGRSHPLVRRVIAVGSAAHKLLKSADVDALIRPGTADPRMRSRQRGSYQMRSYQTAKLAVTTWTYGLARRWAGRGVTANVLDPGIVKGKSGSEHFEGPAPMRILMSHVIPFFVAAGTQKGSQQYVRLAADPALASVSGIYFIRGKEKEQGSSPLALDPAAQKRIDDAADEWAAPFLRGR
jgi:NAD(P)-dependent dehydrogenase (short-subunit alcohol dehydrogenase family)